MVMKLENFNLQVMFCKLELWLFNLQFIFWYTIDGLSELLTLLQFVTYRFLRIRVYISRTLINIKTNTTLILSCVFYHN